MFYMKRFLALILALSFVLPAQAQSNKVTARVVDSEANMGVIGAIVEIVAKDNPDKRKHTVSGADGVFTITSVAAGDYTMNITFIGYSTVTRDISVKGNLDLGVIEIAPEAVAIETVVKEVQALRTSQNGDTVAYNAAAFKVASDADVEGLLKKMPGITISNGSVEAQGEQVKKIFVDGKEFFGEDVSTALNSLPAQAVDRIEVFNKLSDNAEFSGMDDGEGYKAINIITHSNMRQGVFGKVYGGYGYQPDTDDVTSEHKYNAGGNVNIFNKSDRISIIGLLNNVNQQNFSFEDILGVTGGGGGPGGGRGRGVGRYMVRPQNGVARVGSIGVQYSGAWGENEKVKLNGSYFFNSTNTQNVSRLEKWYYDPSPADTLEQDGRSDIANMNHRVNVRFDWAINRNMSLMSRTNFSFQGNDPESWTDGKQWGESGYNITKSGSVGSSRALRFSEFLQYRVKLGDKPGRTITVDGRVSYKNTPRSWSNSYSTLETIEDPTTGLYIPDLRYVSSFAPENELDLGANFTYTEPVSKNAQLSMQYRFESERQEIDKASYITDDSFDIAGLAPNDQLSSTTDSHYMEHKVGPGFRYAKSGNNVVANVYYQYSVLDALVKNKPVKNDFHDFTYFLMSNIAFNSQNTMRLFVMSHSENPKVQNLQEVYDLSNAQFISKGNENLEPAYTHRINLRYVRSNMEKGRTFMWMFSGQFTQDYIGQSVTYNPGKMDIDGVAYDPLQYTTYANLDGYRSLRTHLSYGFPITPIKCNLNVMAGVSWTRTPSLIDGNANFTSNIGYDAMLSLGSNISENIDFTVQWNGTFNDTKQSLAMRNAKNTYFNHAASGTLKWVFWKGFTLTAAVNYNQYIGFTNDYNEDYLICNVYLGKKVFKNQMGEVMIGVNDLLDQNTAFARTVGSGYTQNMTNSAVGRYFTVQFTYNLRFFGKNASNDINDYDGMNVSGKHGAFGRPPMHR